MKIHETGSNYSDYYPKEGQKAEPSKAFNLEEPKNDDVELPKIPESDRERLLRESREYMEKMPTPNLERGKKSS